jgi:hypothetical protein
MYFHTLLYIAMHCYIAVQLLYIAVYCCIAIHCYTIIIFSTDFIAVVPRGRRSALSSHTSTKTGAYKHIHTHTNIHAYIHTYIHIHTLTRFPALSCCLLLFYFLSWSLPPFLSPALVCFIPPCTTFSVAPPLSI